MRHMFSCLVSALESETRVPMYLSLFMCCICLFPSSSVGSSLPLEQLVAPNELVSIINKSANGSTGSSLEPSRDLKWVPLHCLAQLDWWRRQAPEAGAAQPPRYAPTGGTPVVPTSGQVLVLPTSLLAPLEDELDVADDDYESAPDDDLGQRSRADRPVDRQPDERLASDSGPQPKAARSVWSQLKRAAGGSSTPTTSRPRRRQRRQASSTTDLPPIQRDPFEQLLSELLEPLLRGQQSTTRRPQGPREFESILSGLVRRLLTDLPGHVANLGQLAANVLSALTLNNPVIANSPTRLRLVGGQSSAANSTGGANRQQQPAAGSLALDLLEALLRRMQARRQQQPQQPEGTARPETGAESELLFLDRLNNLTATSERAASRRFGRRLPRAARTRTKRSLAAALMLSPFSRLYAAMLMNRVLKYQSGLFSQALMSELIRKYLVPAGGQLVNSALNPAGSYLAYMKSTLSAFERGNLHPVSAAPQPALAPTVDCQMFQSQFLSAARPPQPTQASAPLQGGLPQLTDGSGPLLTMNEGSLSMDLTPDTRISVPNLVSKPYSLLRAAYGFPQELSSASNQSLYVQAPPDGMVHKLPRVQPPQKGRPKSENQARNRVKLELDPKVVELLDYLGGIGALHQPPKSAEPSDLSSSPANSSAKSQNKEYSVETLAEQIINRTIALGLNRPPARGAWSGVSPGAPSLANSGGSLVKETSDMLSGSFRQLVRDIDFGNGSASTTTARPPVQIVLDAEKTLSVVERLLTSKSPRAFLKAAAPDYRSKGARPEPAWRRMQQPASSLRVAGARRLGEPPTMAQEEVEGGLFDGAPAAQSGNPAQRRKLLQSLPAAGSPNASGDRRSTGRANGTSSFSGGANDPAATNRHADYEPAAHGSPEPLATGSAALAAMKAANESESAGSAAHLSNLAMALNVMNMVLLNQKLATNSNETQQNGALAAAVAAGAAAAAAQQKPAAGNFLILARAPAKRNRYSKKHRGTSGRPAQEPAHLYGADADAKSGPTSSTRAPLAHHGTSSSAPEPKRNPPAAESEARPTKPAADGLEREQLSNHRATPSPAPSRFPEEAGAAGAARRPTEVVVQAQDLGYLYQPLLVADGPEQDHALRWNDVLRHLTVNRATKPDETN